MKICTICKETKSISCFHKKNKSKDGYQNICKECSSLKSQDYYKSNAEKHKSVTRTKRKEERRQQSEYLSNLKKQYGCQLCQESEPCCLEFHHCSGKKEFNISQSRMMGIGFVKLESEISKCIILCSNCHKKVHANLLQLNEYNFVKLDYESFHSSVG